MAKFQLKKSRFINWYFSDPDTRSDFGNNAVWKLQLYGKVNITVDELFDSCGYIPQWLCEGQAPDEGEDLEPKDVELID